MNVTDALKSRYSCRAFKSDPVRKETLLKIMEAALHAPSWANTQPWEIFVASGPAIERLRKAYLANLQNEVPRHPDIPVPEKWPEALQHRIETLGMQRLKQLNIEREDKAARQRLTANNYNLFNAPAVVFLCMDRKLTPWSMFDLGSLSQSIMLAAEEHGLGSIVAVMLAAYPDIIRKELDVPDNLSIVIGIALGYCDRQDPMNQFRSERRPVDAAVTFKES